MGNFMGRRYRGKDGVTASAVCGRDGVKAGGMGGDGETFVGMGLMSTCVAHCSIALLFSHVF